MEKIDKFNIRVYALLIIDEKLLVIKEQYAGETLVKFPGGGLEFGEGIIDCLKREFMEELNLKVIDCVHFYTQEDFVRSKFRKNEQLLTIYYQVKVENIAGLQVLDNEIQELRWIDLTQLSVEMLPLPIDKIVVEKLLQTKNS